MNIILFLCGVALFLLGISQLEQGLGRLGDKALKKILANATHTPLQGALVGMVATVMVQSSSVVSLLTLAFVSAGALQLFNAIGIILGANLGTTFTGWIVATIGFKLDFKDIYLPLLGMGAAITLWGNADSRMQAVGRFVYGIGLMIMGMLLMKDSIVFITDMFNLEMLRDVPLFVFFIVGALLTAIMQASSAAMMMALTALHGGIIDLESAAAFAVGADLGTTSTVILGSLQGARIKRRVSAVHFIFNVVTDIIAVIFLPWLLYFVSNILGITDPLFALVAFHSTFNLIGICMFLPWVKRLQQLIEWLIPDHDESDRTIDSVDPGLGDVSLHALEQDVAKAIESAILINIKRIPSRVLESVDPALCEKVATIDRDRDYLALQENENILTDYALDMQRIDGTNDNVRLKQLLVCLRDSSYGAKAYKDIKQDLAALEDIESGNQALDSLLATSALFHKQLLGLIVAETNNLSEQLSELANELKANNKHFDTALYSLIDNRQLSREAASRGLNLNRQILLAGYSLLNALKHYGLSEPAAQTLSEILNLPR